MKSRYFPWIVLLPILAWCMVFVFWPLVNVFRLSFFDWNVLRPELSQLAGIRNYSDLTRDSQFFSSLKNTLQYILIKPLIAIPLGLAIAALLTSLKRGQKIVLLFVYMPNICAVAAMSILFKWLYQPRFGLFNAVLEALRLPPQGFLNDPGQAIYSIIASDIWQTLGYQVVLFVAGLLAISSELIEAAQIDGAKYRQVFFRIRLPLLRPVMLFVAATILIQAFQEFDRIFAMSLGGQGGPGDSTYVLAFFIYRNAFFHWRTGYASASAMVLFFMVMIVTFMQIRLFRQDTEY